MPSQNPAPRGAPRAPSRSPLPLVVASLVATAGLLAWQALAVPVLAMLLLPMLGTATLVIVQALSLLGGGLLLYLLLRGAIERVRADAALDSARPWVDCERQLLELGRALPVGMLVVSEGRIVSANDAARELLGLASQPLANVEPMTVFVDRARASEALSGRMPHVDTLPMRRANGETFRARLAVHGITLDRRGFRVLMFDDLSESDRIDARLGQQRMELQALAGRLLTVQEDERRVLSRELHDDVGQAITAIKLGAVSLLHRDERADGTQDEDARARHTEIVNEIIATADQTVVKLRDLSMLLRPPQLDALGLEAALRWQSQALFRSNPTELELDLTPLPHRPDPAVELACFRIAQEALTNVLRHAGARRVTVTLAAQDRTLVLSVQDDGHGFDPGRTHGLGLVTMRERAQQLGGSFRIDTDPGVGTRLHARLPMTLAGDDSE